MAHPSRGFIALLSVLMLSGLLLALAAAASIDVSLAQDAAMDEYSYRAATAAAWSCARLAFNRLSADPDRFAGGEATHVSFQTDSCDILAASTTETRAGASVEGFSGKSAVPLYVTARRVDSSSPYSLTSWEEYEDGIDMP